MDPASLRFYSSDVHKNDDFRTLYLEGSQIVSCSAWWDPSFGGNGDGSVLAIIYADAEGRYFMHHISYLRTDPKAEEDEATQQCRKVAQLAHTYHVPSLTLEINGIGKFCRRF